MESRVIRPAHSGDIDQILRIEEESFDPSLRENRSTFQERMETFPDGFVMLEAEGSAAGYLCSELWLSQGGPSASGFALGHSARERHNPGGQTLYISSFGIRAGFRGRGLGADFFRGFLEYARGKIPHREILLLACETWKSALAIYAAEGFSRIRGIPGFFRFSDGTQADGLILRKDRDSGSSVLSFTGRHLKPMM